MTTKKLLELLALVNHVTISRWKTVMDLVECIKEQKGVKIIKSEWHDSFKKNNPKFYPLNLSQIETWSTYDGECISLIFSEKEGKLYCHVKIYDGDSFGGTRTNIRFTAELILPNSFIRKIEGKINWAFEVFLTESYEQHLESQKLLWINNLKSQIINNAK